jgi:hypothetical protein
MQKVERNSDSKPKEQAIELARIEVTPLARSLMQLPEDQPYLGYVEAVLCGRDKKEALQQIRALPFENRYTSRIVGALALAFADFDSLCVEADKQATTRFQWDALLAHELSLRLFQFCLFLRTLLGPDEMERIIGEAITFAKSSSPASATRGS